MTRPRLTCIDLFAGCGGLSLGLEDAGFRPLLFSELSLSAAETYIANRAGRQIVPIGDIYNLTDANLDLLKLNWRYEGIEEVDLVCGGPPCQGYSGIGHRRSFEVEKKRHTFQPPLPRNGPGDTTSETEGISFRECPRVAHRQMVRKGSKGRGF